MGFCFFFQAEDGIRDGRVTGVQTCALPISHARLGAVRPAARGTARHAVRSQGPSARRRGGEVGALRHLDRTKVKHTVIFIWSTREEIGLEGAAAAAAALGPTPRRVHAIDTFVSADSPLELPIFAVAPI